MNWNRTIGFAGALLALAGFSGAASAQVEARCAELGNTCVMSEPLNFNAPVPLILGGSGFDPPDSEGPGAKEAQRQYYRIQGAANGTRMVPANNVGLSIDASPGYVMQTPGETGDGGLWEFGRNFTDGTYCARKYFSHPVGYTNNMQHYKFADFYGDQSGVAGKGPGFAFFKFTDAQSNSGTLWGHVAENAWGWPQTPMPSISGLNSVTMDDNCTQGNGSGSNWCRFEVCFDHNWDGTDRLRVRTKHTDIDSGAEHLLGMDGTASIAEVQSGNRSWLVKQKQNSGNGCNGCAKGNYWSHLMISIKQPADPNFWIGAAREITTDVASGGTPPPVAQAPAAPVLLD